ncbi:GlyGly-CTERM sorting domain-containing protein [Aliikangiella coralliicola]|uniref:GlyGly-CTERM sorting domain-containing protein n=1 Tax=Aliikangiella coralliicola TaxID=2592383 RepID=A0A545UD02_9GAMM|nr:Ig-like domain-containing protein [Aliikangiella coralliicola]TQV87313.1 GlyGly-CTERM sorting domain-containing protein [Aliikangiella coralliicola]
MHKFFNRTTVAVCVSTALVAGASGLYFSADKTNSYENFVNKRAFLEQKKASKVANPKRYDKPQEALDFYVKQRAPIGSKALPAEKYSHGLRHMANMNQYSIRADKMMPSRNQLKASGLLNKATPTEPGVVGDWDNIGPGNIGGRTRTLVIHPETPEIMYSAGVAGGVWKTIDAGQNWLPLDDMMLNLAITGLVMSPTEPDTLYAATGEGFFNADSLRGDGIFKSTDAGATWSQLSSTGGNVDFRYVNKIEASTVTENRLFAATRAGLFRSDDAGETWTKLMDAPNSDGCMDVKVRTDKDNDELLVSCGSFSGATVYRSTNGGDDLTPVIEDEFLGRTTLAFAPSNQDIAYALSAANSSDQTAYRNGFYKLFRTEDGGATWEVKNSNQNAEIVNTLLLSNPVFGLFPECGGPNRSFFNQGWYDNIVKVDPVNPDVVWAGGVDLWRSDDAGENWSTVSRWWTNSNDSSYAHADQHEIVFHPDYDGDTNKTLFVGNDGGIQRTDNADGNTLGLPGICGANVADAVSWTGLNNNFGITQFYHGALFPDGSVYIGGTQDNGTNLGQDATGPQAWFEINGGDGGWVAVDPRNPLNVFTENTRLSLTRQNLGDGSSTRITTGIEDGQLFPFITPFMMDSNNPDRLWIGNNRLWRTEDQGDTWTQASAPTIDNSIVSEWAVAPGNSDRVIAGTDSGTLLISTAATQTTATTQWLTVQPSQGYVSDIAIHPNNNNITYVTYSTFGVPHIWKTLDGGVTWNAIDNQGQPNGLPDVPVNTIVIDPTNTARIFVGTDLGIFVSVDAGQNWSIDGSGFANTAVAHLEINNGNLFAFTHGRSAYKVELSTLPSALPTSASTDEDTPLAFSADMFNAFYPTTPEIETVVLSALPTNGTLTLNGENVTELAPVAIAEIANLSFVPASNFNGEVSIGWHVEASDVATSTRNDLNITVNPVNDAPVFAISQQETEVQINHRGLINVSTVTPAEIPTDEATQTVTYSISPTTSDILGIEFDENTGSLQVRAIPDMDGTVTFTITADDGQAANSTHSETVSFKVTRPPKGSGSFGWLSLLILPLVAMRRKLRG